MSIFEGTFAQNESKAVLVCTKTDKCEDKHDRLESLKCMLSKKIEVMLKCPLDVSKVIGVSNFDEKSYSEVRKMLINLIEKSLGHSNFVPFKHMFFYRFEEIKQNIASNECR